MRWILGLGLIGLIIGSVIGLDAASTIDSSDVGGDAVKTLFQWNTFRLYAGWGVGLGMVAGLAIYLCLDYLAETRLERQYERRFRAPDQLSEPERIELEDVVAARMQRRSDARARGLTNEEIDAEERRLLAEAEAAADDDYWARVELASLDPRRWPD